eukprot:TRINITY_DN21676_c0_g1_i1.p1 TRINITY_DN21676_c0_g1~~TRINITY_DN21676_c0_g1_i1.p1  ORF type:complete len:550 (-),score=121.34 TRINITY_DN21676_c0_g1_i1:17-1624(-)
MTSIIHIDSDDEAAPGAADAASRHAAAAAALAAEPLRDRLFCRLFAAPDSGLRPQFVAPVCLWLHDEGRREIHLCKYPGGNPDDVIIKIPVDLISSAEAEEEGPLVVLSFSPPLIAFGFMDEFLAATGAPEHLVKDTKVGSEEKVIRLFSTIAVASAQEEVRAMLATLRAWLSPLALYGPQSLGLVEPVRLRLRGLVLAGRDVDLLADDRWLNDTVLDFFLRLSLELVRPEQLRERFYVANTQLFTRLTACSAGTGEKGWENVKTWTRSMAGGVSSQDYLVYPVNDTKCHWWVAIVCHPMRAMELGGVDGAGAGENAGSDDSPRIVCLDPFPEPLPKDEPVGLIKGYLRRELCGSGNAANASPEELMAQVKRWKAAVRGLEKMVAVNGEAPRQENAFDCGVFVLEYVTHLLRNPSLLARLGLEEHRCWFDQAHVAHRRQRMRDVVTLLQREALRNSASGGDVLALLRDAPGLRDAVLAGLTDTTGAAPAAHAWTAASVPPLAAPGPCDAAAAASLAPGGVGGGGCAGEAKRRRWS